MAKVENLKVVGFLAAFMCYMFEFPLEGKHVGTKYLLVKKAPCGPFKERLVLVSKSINSMSWEVVIHHDLFALLTAIHVVKVRLKEC